MPDTDDVTDPSDVIEHLGPIDYLLIEFSGGKTVGEGLPLLLDLVDRGIIRVFDLVFLRRSLEGQTTIVTPGELDGDGSMDLALFEGARSGLFSDEDIAEIAEIVTPGCSAAVLMYENTWAAPLAIALRRGGGQLVASGRIPVQAVLAALDAIDAAA
jgi:hypothetical protein